MGMTWLQNNVRRLTSGQTRRSAQRLYQGLVNNHGSSSEVNTARLTARSLSLANSRGTFNNLQQFKDNGGVALLNRPSRIAFNETANTVRTGANRELFFRARPPELTSAKTRAERENEFNSLHTIAQTTVQDLSNEARFRVHQQNLWNQLEDAQKTRAEELSTKLVPDAQAALRNAETAFNDANSPENKAALEPVFTV